MDGLTGGWQAGLHNKWMRGGMEAWTVGGQWDGLADTVSYLIRKVL